MVTRKVARSKHDALALTEAQLRESESEDSEHEAKKRTTYPKWRRVAKTESTAIARAANAKKVGKKGKHAAVKDTDKSTKRRFEGDESNAALESAKAKATTSTRERPPPVVVSMTPSSTPVTTPRSSISTRNGGSRRVTPTSAAASMKDGIVPAALLREELERKLQFVDPAIKARFGEVVWAKRAAFPFWPALILDPRDLPEYQLSNALKELDVKCWVQLYGSRDIRQMLFTALTPWDDTTHPYRDGFPRSDVNRLARLKDTFAVALTEASEHEKLTAEERLKVFTTEVVPSLRMLVPSPAPLPVVRKRRKVVPVSKPDTPVAPANGVVSSTADTSSTMQPSQGNGLSTKAATPFSTESEKRKRISAMVTQEVRGGESESRYRLGQLAEYATTLRKIFGNESPDRVWRVQLYLSQLLDEKAFLREDLEKTGIWELIDQLRDSENVPWRDLVETVRNHLKNCTLEEWPSVQRTSVARNSISTRPTSTPLMSGEKRGSADPTHPRTDASMNSSLANGTSTVEAMAEAVARGMISRSNAMPLESASRVTSFGPPLRPAPTTITNATLPSPNFPSMASDSNTSGGSDTALGTSRTPLSVTSTSKRSAYQQPHEARSGNTPQSSATSRQSAPSIPSTTTSERASARETSYRTPSSARTLRTPTSAAQQSIRAAPVVRSNPSLVIFNKDGTLFDFHTTWGTWVESQSWRLEVALGRPVREAFFQALGYNMASRTMQKGGVFNTTPKHELGPKFAVPFLQSCGLLYAEALRIVKQHWSLPKEVTTFRARHDLVSLFTTIHDLGVKIAVMTSDRRAMTSKTLTHLGVGHLVDLLSCGDDGVANTHERIWTICSRLRVSTQDTVIVGDTADDMTLGRTAGCALSVGVLGGASDLSDLSAEADFLVPSVTNVIKLLYQYRQQATI